MKKRNVNLDLIRSMAVLSVISVHFFMNTDYYNTLLLGKRMYLSTVMRTGFMVCVPLFLLLSGYLMSNKKLEKRYFFGLVRIIILYVEASICCGFFRYFCLNERSIKKIVLGVFSFQTANYGWYVEMYVGLFLLIPFLNILGDAMKSKREEQLFIGVWLVLTVLPSLFNIYNFEIVDWWRYPSLSYEYNKIIPQFWTGLYPITYYCIGRYIRKYEVKIDPLKGIIVWIILAIAFGSYNFWRGYGQTFPYGSYTDWGGFENTILASLLFVSVKSIDLQNISEVLKKVLYLISENSFVIYLVSWIFDVIFYKRINQEIPYMPDKLKYFGGMVLAVFMASFLLSWILNGLYKIISCKYRKVVNRYSNCVMK